MNRISATLVILVLSVFVYFLPKMAYATANDRLVAGSNFSCAITDIGAVKCWGSAIEGQHGAWNIYDGDAYTVAGLRDVIALSLKDLDACAVTQDGAVGCWRFNIPTVVWKEDLAPAAGIAAGDNHFCALLVDGTIHCWGAQYWGQLGNGVSGVSGTTDDPVQVVGTDNAVKVVVGYEHSCALLASGGVRCWGRNQYGQLGDNSSTNRASPVDVFGITDAVGISAGHGHTCAVLSDQTVKCWGWGVVGQLGDGGSSNAGSPVDVLGLTGVQDIAAGFGHTCVVDAVGDAHCWGNNTYGQLGDGSVASRGLAAPVADLDAGSAVAAGEQHTCAQRNDGRIHCWGDNDSAQLGTDYYPTRLAPIAVAGLGGSVGDIGVAGSNASTYAEHACAVLAGGGVQCWGANPYGQLGDGSWNPSRHPVDVLGIADAIQISTAGARSCALLQSGGVRCWGSGLLGDGGDPGEPQPSPVMVAGLIDAMEVDIAQSLACVLRETGDVACWGRVLDISGTVLQYNEPIDIDGIDDAIQVAVGGQGYSSAAFSTTLPHACVLHADRTVSCFGGNAYGQLGDGTNSYSATPVPVAGLANVERLDLGRRHSCAVLQSGSVRCWGSNAAGQLGNASTEDSSAPVPVYGLENAVGLSAGEWHTCAIRSDGTAQCWGDNNWGQLGDNTLTRRTVPTLVSGLAGVVQIAAGGDNSCAVLADGTAACWGSTDAGQLGNGEARIYTTPIPVAATPFFMHWADYSAGANGSLSGDLAQAVDHGADAMPVLAVPASGYVFVGWSDEVMSNPRTDLAVQADIDVTALFEPEPEGVDIQVTVIPLNGSGATKGTTGGDALFEIQVLNLGPEDAQDIRLTMTQARGVSEPGWGCQVAVGACIPEVGVGLPETRFDLANGSMASIVITGVIDVDDHFFVIDATAAPAGETIVRNTDDDSAHFVTPSSPVGIFLGDFE